MTENRVQAKDPLLAGMLACIPGAGHFYCGERLRGVTYLAGTVAGLILFVVPGLFIWAASIPDVVLCVRRRNELLPPRLHPSAVPIADLQISDGPDPVARPSRSPEPPPVREPEPDPSPRSSR